MKKSRFTEGQSIGVPKQHEAGMKTADLCRKHEISASTFYSWKAKYGGMDVSEAQRLKAMEDENRRLKHLVADLILNQEILKAVTRKNGWNFHPTHKDLSAGTLAWRLEKRCRVRFARVRVSERKACRLLGPDRSSDRDESRPNSSVELCEALMELARQKPRYGYRPLHAVLCRRGHEVNVKRVYRLYSEGGQTVRRRRRKWLVRDPLASARLLRANQGWAMDFIVDGLASGRMVCILSVVDAYTRECQAPVADTSLGTARDPGAWAADRRAGRPESVRSDHGPEVCSQRMLG